MDNGTDNAVFHSLSVDDATRLLNTNIDAGLTFEEAGARLEKYGPNEFKQKKRKTLAAKFLEQFLNFLVGVLLVAAIISGVVGYMNNEGVTDAILILLIVVVNAVIGVIQDAKAEKSLEALERMSAPFCKALRGGRIETLEVRHLVPGDVVIIETGDLVPADLRLVEAVNLKIQEAALTGESEAVEKGAHTVDAGAGLGDRLNMAFSSCIVTYGRGKGIVVGTGMESEVGKIAAMIQDVPDKKTPLQIKIDQLGKFLGLAAMAICVVIFFIGYFQDRGALYMFMIAVSLAVAAIPEGLPAVSTIVQAIGVNRLAARNAIVRNLPSVETLGSTTVICSDKTGTLTQNKMTVVRMTDERKLVEVPESPDEMDETQRQLLKTFILANDSTIFVEDDGSRRAAGDPTETALVDLGLRLGMDKETLEAEYTRLKEIPFDSVRKMMSTVNRDQSGALYLFTKGGLDEVMASCDRVMFDGQIRPLENYEREAVNKFNDEMAGQALRVLSAAYKPLDSMPDDVTPESLENNLIFCGIVGLIDPPRPEAKLAVATCRSAGIKPVMITGDHAVTAGAIAESLGIKQEGDLVIVGSELEKMSDEELVGKIEQTSVFARVSPEHKLRIVNAFREQGEITAMTGDGVNDAPALKLADIGVAMAITGTDVAKEASDIVLADDNFATIVSAVEEGRRIYENILKSIQYLLSTNIGEVILIFVAILANWATPLVPVQILWINLVGDSLPALALGMDPANPDIMDRPPRNPRESIMNPRFLANVTAQGVLIGLLTLVAFIVGMRWNVLVAQTMTFAVLCFSKVLHSLNVRSGIRSGFINMFNNKFLHGSLVIVTILTILLLFTPALQSIFHLTDMNKVQWIWVICLSIAPLPIVELVKAGLRLAKK